MVDVSILMSVYQKVSCMGLHLVGKVVADWPTSSSRIPTSQPYPTKKDRVGSPSSLSQLAPVEQWIPTNRNISPETFPVASGFPSFWPQPRHKAWPGGDRRRMSSHREHRGANYEFPMHRSTAGIAGLGIFGLISDSRDSWSSWFFSWNRCGMIVEPWTLNYHKGHQMLVSLSRWKRDHDNWRYRWEYVWISFIQPHCSERQDIYIYTAHRYMYIYIYNRYNIYIYV